MIPNTGGKSDPLLIDVFHKLRLIKYFSLNQAKQTNEFAYKICTKPIFKLLVDNGWFAGDEVFKTTNKVLDFLQEQGVNRFELPKELEGYGDINSLNNTDIFLQCFKLEYYFKLLFPVFPKKYPKLMPDALLVLKNVNKYKLIFLEIEAKKENWKDRLEEKRPKYLELSHNEAIFNYWQEACKHFNLGTPLINNFYFSVLIIGNIKLDWEEGFIFKNKFENSN